MSLMLLEQVPLSKFYWSVFKDRDRRLEVALVKVQYFH